MIIIAMTLYLPQHITFLTSRAWFYYNGPEAAKAGVRSVVESAVKSTSTVLVERVRETVVNAGSTVGGVTREL
jgi:hypothetical protein